MTALPTQVFEPFGWENPMPTLPTDQLSLKEQKRTGHIFKGCPVPLPVPDTKSANAPEQCELCAETLRVCKAEGEKWHALQQADARIWKVNGIALKADGNTVPFPGKLPTQEHADALNINATKFGTSEPVYTGPVAGQHLPSTPLPATVKVEPTDEGEADIPAMPMATEKQVALLVRLAAEKTPEWFNKLGQEEVTKRAQGRTRADASKAIDALMARPTVGNLQQMKRGPVPAGHYALPTVSDDATNSLAFYRVDCPTEGKWAGYTFLKQVIGGQDPVRVPKNLAASILARIAADPDAGPRYGREIGRCCRCNRTLTNDESRAEGIGPECRNKM